MADFYTAVLPEIEHCVSKELDSPWKFSSEILPRPPANHPIACLQGTNGVNLFIKESEHTRVANEVRGLKLLSAKGSVRTPRIFGICDKGSNSILVLEKLQTREPADGDWQKAGRQLASLHRDNRSERFGLDQWFDDWPSFYGELRLRPDLKKARDGNLINLHLCDKIEQLIKRLPEIVGPPEPPCLLHGDFWGTNVLFDENGPVFIDPACYYGHREMDVTYSKLWDRIPTIFREWYRQNILAEGDIERREVYWVYYWLAHLTTYRQQEFHEHLKGAVEAALKVRRT